MDGCIYKDSSNKMKEDKEGSRNGGGCCREDKRGEKDDAGKK